MGATNKPGATQKPSATTQKAPGGGTSGVSVHPSLCQLKQDLVAHCLMPLGSDYVRSK